MWWKQPGVVSRDPFVMSIRYHTEVSGFPLIISVYLFSIFDTISDLIYPLFRNQISGHDAVSKNATNLQLMENYLGIIFTLLDSSSTRAERIKTNSNNKKVMAKGHVEFWQ